MFVLQVYTVLWWMTIIGGVIKRYSYFLVPYIVAENPDIHAGEAITLSRKMMNGHKWECFVLQLSFPGWNILGMVTGGLVALFFKNPYQTAVNCEYYGMLRRLGKEAKIPDTELLNDEYLFVRPEEQELQDVYIDVARETGELNAVKGLTGVRGLLAKYFGVVADWGEKELEYEKEQAIRMRYAVERQALDGKIYPARMCPLPEKESRSDFVGVSYLRCYSIWSLIMIFMIMSVGGWIWEVSLHLITDGEFVNRGVLHGPWLPIYGTGSVLILMLLYRFRRVFYCVFSGVDSWWTEVVGLYGIFFESSWQGLRRRTAGVWSGRNDDRVCASAASGQADPQASQPSVGAAWRISA